MTKQRLAVEVFVIVAAVLVGITLIDLASHIVIWLMKLVYVASRKPSRLDNSGGVAERLGRGLQSPPLRFESGRRLQA
jgi:hypothetical protein